MRVRPASWAKRIALATRGSGDKRHLHFVDTNSNFTFSHLARPFNSSGLKFVSLSSQFYFLPSSVASRAGRLLVWSLSSTLLERFVFVFFFYFLVNPTHYDSFGVFVLLGLVFFFIFIFIFYFHITVSTTVYVMILSLPRFFTLPESRL